MQCEIGLARSVATGAILERFAEIKVAGFGQYDAFASPGELAGDGDSSGAGTDNGDVAIKGGSIRMARQVGDHLPRSDDATRIGSSAVI